MDSIDVDRAHMTYVGGGSGGALMRLSSHPTPAFSKSSSFYNQNSNSNFSSIRLWHTQQDEGIDSTSAISLRSSAPPPPSLEGFLEPSDAHSSSDPRHQARRSRRALIWSARRSQWRNPHLRRISRVWSYLGNI